MVEAILIGFMGSGKTTIGRMLAQTIQHRHLDLDDLIVSHTAKTINQIFADHGEQYFRNLETDCLEISLGKAGILSTGGGTIVREKNQQLIMKNPAPVIYLKTSLETIIDRLKGDKTRPLLQSGNDSLMRLYQKRILYYEQAADVIIATDNKSAQRIAEDLIGIIGL